MGDEICEGDTEVEGELGGVTGKRGSRVGTDGQRRHG